MDLIPLLGRFHVVVLHLPIGILAFTAALEIYFSFSRRAERPTLISAFWLAGLLTAAVTSGLGYLLSLSGGYNEAPLTLHLLWGLATTLIALLGWLCFGPAGRRGKGWAMGCGGMQILTLSVTGHLGGSLTHGPEFLFEHAPNPIRALGGFAPRLVPRPALTSLDDAEIYLDIVQPILAQRCTSCHNPAKTKGDLLLDTYAGIIAGGKSGATVIPGDSAASELSVRINLDPAHKKFMPSGGKTPLTWEQTTVLDWWIQIGAPAEGALITFSPDAAFRKILAAAIGMETNENELGLPQREPLAQASIQILEDAGFDAKRISETNAYLDVDYYALGDTPISDATLEALLPIHDQIAWLNLSSAGVTDSQLRIIAQLPNLLRLNLAENPITDAGLAKLRVLKRLQMLVLHGTSVTDASLPLLDALPNLSKAFLWDTAVTTTDHHRPYLILGPAALGRPSPSSARPE